MGLHVCKLFYLVKMDVYGFTWKKEGPRCRGYDILYCHYLWILLFCTTSADKGEQHGVRKTAWASSSARSGEFYAFMSVKLQCLVPFNSGHARNCLTYLFFSSTTKMKLGNTLQSEWIFECLQHDGNTCFEQKHATLGCREKWCCPRCIKASWRRVIIMVLNLADSFERCQNLIARNLNLLLWVQMTSNRS